MVGYKELKNLQGRIVLITGASSGMGEQIGNLSKDIGE